MLKLVQFNMEIGSLKQSSRIQQGIIYDKAIPPANCISLENVNDMSKISSKKEKNQDQIYFTPIALIFFFLFLIVDSNLIYAVGPEVSPIKNLNHQMDPSQHKNHQMGRPKQSNSSENPSETVVSHNGVETLVFPINGMFCQMCVKAIENKVCGKEPFIKCKANVINSNNKKGQLQISINKDLNLDKMKLEMNLKNWVKEAGYEVGD